MNFERFTRRDALKTLPLFAAASLQAAEATPFRFLAVNDLHYLADPCGDWFRAMVAQMKADAPDVKFCLLCGDLADRGDKASLKAVSDIFSEIGVPLHPVPGNHDYTPEESRAGYDEVFPGKLNYRFMQGSWQFIGLDTTMGTKYNQTTIADSTLAWLDAEPLDTKAPTVVFTHFPLGEGVTYRPLNADALLGKLAKIENVVAGMSGHWHGLSEHTTGHTLLTTSRCSARVRTNADKSPLKGWWVCEASSDGKLKRRFVEFKAPPEIPTDDVAGKK